MYTDELIKKIKNIHPSEKGYICEKLEYDTNEIIPNIWLGNSKAAHDKNFLLKYKITHIINVTPNVKCMYPKDFNYIVIPIKDEDTCNSNLINMFDEATDYIHKHWEQGSKILIHCKRGHHRSAAILVAFIMRYFDIDYKIVMKYITHKRICAFRRQTCISTHLDLYDKIIKERNMRKIIY